MFASILSTFLCWGYPTIARTAVIESNEKPALVINLQTIPSFSLLYSTDSILNEDEKSDPYSNFLFYEKTQTYYPYAPGSAIQGPCGTFMKLYKKSTDSNNGVCRCEEGTSSCPGRPLVYWKETKQCYYAYEQGPCGEGEWLIRNKKNKSVCQRNPCPSIDAQDGSFSYVFYFSYKDVCYRTNSTAFCEGGERVFVLNTQKTPICLTDQPTCYHPYNLPHSAPQQCPPGTRAEDDGSCAKIVYFE